MQSLTLDSSKICDCQEVPDGARPRERRQSFASVRERSERVGLWIRDLLRSRSSQLRVRELDFVRVRAEVRRLEGPSGVRRHGVDSGAGLCADMRGG